jgi:hypothetical protein
MQSLVKKQWAVSYQFATQQQFGLYACSPRYAAGYLASIPQPLGSRISIKLQKCYNKLLAAIQNHHPFTSFSTTVIHVIHYVVVLISIPIHSGHQVVYHVRYVLHKIPSEHQKSS